MMRMNAIVKGISIGASVGTAAAVLFNAAEHKKSNIKRHAGKMIRAAGEVLDDITSVVK